MLCPRYEETLEDGDATTTGSIVASFVKAVKAVGPSPSCSFRLRQCDYFCSEGAEQPTP